MLSLSTTCAHTKYDAKELLRLAKLSPNRSLDHTVHGSYYPNELIWDDNMITVSCSIKDCSPLISGITSLDNNKVESLLLG